MPEGCHQARRKPAGKGDTLVYFPLPVRFVFLLVHPRARTKVCSGPSMPPLPLIV